MVPVEPNNDTFFWIGDGALSGPLSLEEFEEKMEESRKKKERIDVA